MQWAQKIDQGPYSCLALGERIFFPSPELMTTLGACAVLTERVKLVTTVIILPMHNPVLTAKQLATVDVLSEGRLVVGVGTGGRDEDYLATGTDLSQKRISVMASHVDIMRKIWRGEQVVDDALRIVEPLPVQKNGPPILAGVMGPKGLASAAKWADGISGMSVSAQAADAEQSMQLANTAWLQAGQKKPPQFNSAFWFALGDNADQQMQAHLTRYFNWLDPGSRDAMATHAGFRGSVKDLKDRLKAFADTGMDELVLIPTSIDPNEVDRANEAIASL
jgi:alkanesulfonate monooxygenase SsuD/methylene tetrahydromethanopterin reductase-like flavin-dependent oxidoreductase (luciferase family)